MGSESERTTEKSEFAIGIDLGTTYSSVGIWRSGRVDIIGDPSSTSKLIPSFVAFRQEYDEEKEEYIIETVAGDSAVNTDNFSTTKTIFDSKRMIGRRFSDETVQRDMKLWPFKVIQGSDDKPMISVTFEEMGETKEYAPEDISAEVLKRLKAIVEDYLSTDTKKVVVEDAVITVPAYFNQSQRQATRDAGKKAGLNVLRLINEPTAAAVAYTLYENGVDKMKNVLVFDLGGGTFDVSCLAVTNNNIVVKAVRGDSHLGGQDFVHRMVNHFVAVFKRKHKKDISGDISAMRKLRKECERCKKSLSSAKKVKTAIESLCGVDYFQEEMTRAMFEKLNSDLFRKCIDIVKECLEDARMDKNDVDDVVLVGGSSRIPKVRQMLCEFMNGKGLYKKIDPAEAVVMGAAIQAALLSGRGGEAIEKLKLVDVTPLSLGTDIVGDVMTVLIPKNTPIPARAVKGFITAGDYQTEIKSFVYEGERARASANKLLGEITLTGIEPKLRGVATIDMCFDLQEDGILEVSAKDRATGKKISTTIQDVKLSCEEVQRMVEEAKENEASDELLMKKKEASDSFVSYICRLRNERKSMKGDEKKKGAIEEAFKWLDSTKHLAEVSEYEEKKKKLMRLMDA